MEETQTQDRAVEPMEESAFLKLVEAPEMDVDAVIAQITALRASGNKEQAESRAELAQDTLRERKAIDGALRILELRVSWAAPNSPFNEQWQQEVLDVLGLSWEQKTTIDNVSGGRLISAREAVRRIRLIRALHPGVLCYDKTWGLGVVSKVDFYYARVEIDFERKLGHQLSIAYAGETLKLVTEDHLLAWKHHKKEDLQKLVQTQPSEVVVMALRSFGPMPLPQLQSTLVPGIVTAADWKRFWDQARKELKKSPRVVIPTARTQSLCLVTDDKSRGDDWYVALAKERDLEKLITRFEELAEHKPASLAESERATLQERYAFLLKGATQKQLGISARARGGPCDRPADASGPPDGRALLRIAAFPAGASPDAGAGFTRAASVPRGAGQGAPARAPAPGHAVARDHGVQRGDVLSDG
jgi:transcription elongation factor GreA-like protein